MARLQHVDEGRWDDVDIDLSGFEGEWFDPYDVQGYLEEHYACKLDPRSAYFECWIDEEEVDEAASQTDSSAGQISGENDKSTSLTHSSTAISVSDTSSSVAMTPPAIAFNGPEPSFGLDMNFNHASTPNYPFYLPKLVDEDEPIDQNLGLDFVPRFEFGVPFTTGEWGADMPLAPALMSENVKSVGQTRKRRAWVDMKALVRELIRNAVCLGRAPAFRRRHVDMALRKRLVDAF